MKRHLVMTALMLVATAVCLFGQGALVPDVDTGIKPDLISGRISGFSGLGTRSGEFLSIPTDARGVALGGAYTASADGLGSVYFNPAGLGFITGPTFTFTTINLTLDFQMNHAAGVVTFADGAMVAGGFATFLTMDPLEVTTVYRPEGTGDYFDSYSSVIGGTFAYNISDRFSAGVNLKWVHEDIWDITANAFSMDIGANYHTEFLERTVRLGLVIRNLGTNMTFKGNRLYREIDPARLMDDESPPREITTKRQTRSPRYGNLRASTFSLPTFLSMGIMYQVLTREFDGLMVCGDFSQPNNLDYTFNTGTEYYRVLAEGYRIAGRFGWEFKGDELNHEMQNVKDGEFQFATETYVDEIGQTQTQEVPVMETVDESEILRGLSLGAGFTHEFSTFSLNIDYAYRHTGLLGNWQFVTVSLGF